ncbi:MAG: Crp/Fnr family transcriptional regulator, partial [Acidimicrobiia bacterium]
AVAHTFEEEFFNEGQRIMRQGFRSPSFYVIVEGEAVVKIDGKDRGKLSRGDFFGELSILLGEAPTADIVASSHMRCLSMPGSDVEGFLTAYPRVMWRMLQTEARRLKIANQWQN